MAGLVAVLDYHYKDEPVVERQVLGSGLRLHTSPIKAFDSLPPSLLAEIEALICYYQIKVTPALLDRMPGLKVVTRAGVGYDNIDVVAAGARGVAVCNTPDYGTMDIADHAIALALTFLRGIDFYTSSMHADPVAGWRFDASPTVRRLNTLTYGVVGLGRIGTASALRAKALGMRVRFFDPYRTTGTELSLGFERDETLEELVGNADVVTIHAPLTDETRGLVNGQLLQRFRPGAILVNTARGPIVDLDAVKQALESGRLGGAGLDVFPEEPVPADHPLLRAWRAPDSPLRHRLVLTPHAAWFTPSSVADVRRKSAETTRKFLETGASRDIVNSEHLRAR